MWHLCSFTGRGSIDSPRIVIFTLEYGQFCAIHGIAVAVLDMYAIASVSVRERSR